MYPDLHFFFLSKLRSIKAQGTPFMLRLKGPTEVPNRRKLHRQEMNQEINIVCIFWHTRNYHLPLVFTSLNYDFTHFSKDDPQPKNPRLLHSRGLQPGFFNSPWYGSLSYTVQKISGCLQASNPMSSLCK